MVPVKGTQTQAPDVATHTCPAGEAPGQFVITKANATHLGNYTGGGINCIGIMTGTFSRADVTLIAANGDELMLENDPLNPGQIVFFDPATLAFISVGGANIVGGTARFEGAIGHVTVRSVGTAGAPGAVTTIAGEISSTGSNK